MAVATANYKRRVFPAQLFKARQMASLNGEDEIVLIAGKV